MGILREVFKFGGIIRLYFFERSTSLPSLFWEMTAAVVRLSLLYVRASQNGNAMIPYTNRDGRAVSYSTQQHTRKILQETKSHEKIKSSYLILKFAGVKVKELSLRMDLL